MNQPETEDTRSGGSPADHPRPWAAGRGPGRQSPDYLELEGALGALRDVLVETLLGIVGQLEGNLRGATGSRHQQQREQPAAPTARGGRPARRRTRPRHPEAAAASAELRRDAESGLRGLAARRRPQPESLRASGRFGRRSEPPGAGKGC